MVPRRDRGRDFTDDELLAECRVETFRSGGPGGQHQNTAESGVRLTHEPTGIQAVSRDSPSQHRNRKTALRRLRRKLEKRAQRKPRRVPTKVPKAQRRKRLEEKRKRGRKKKLRKPPKDQE